MLIRGHDSWYLEEYKIRLAQLDDLPYLPDIEKAAAVRFEPFGLAETMATIVTTEEDFKEGLAAGRLWVAADRNNVPIGFALMIVLDGNAHLDELDVLPEHGRKGLGAALVEVVCYSAQKAGFKAITLSTLQEIPWNVPFYTRLGFQVLQENEMSDSLKALVRDEIARGLPAEGRVIMRRELPSLSK
ncbi:MAG TPA: GNAT family N-acetyltransferase [Aggregatilineales bacterium]|nr:GNAT family N-acetyltransferase [Aggregatilineales bacterium]